MSLLVNVKSGMVSGYSGIAISPAPKLDLKAIFAPISSILQKPQVIPTHPEYIEFTRRMHPLKRQIMELRLAHVSHTSIIQLLQAIEGYDWYKDPFFDQPGWTDIVMEALRKGSIDRYAASTLLLFWKRTNEEKKNNLQIIPLFDMEGNPTIDAIKTICQSLKFAKKSDIRSSDSYLTRSQILHFFYEMKNVHNLQKYFFLSYEQLQSYSGMTIQYEQLDCTPLQYFANASSGDFCRMTPSPQMMETFLTIHCGKENVVQPNLILGSSEWEEFLDITKHDVQVPSPDEPIPEFVHNVLGIKDDFTKHDLGYHLVVKSGIPKRMREIYAQTSLSIKKMEDNTSDPKLRENLQHWRERMLDMDLSIFRQDVRQKILEQLSLKTQDLSQLFWAGFIAQLAQIKIMHNTDIDDTTLKTIIMQMPIDPVLGKSLRYSSLIDDTSRFNTIAKIWEERLNQ